MCTFTPNGNKPIMMAVTAELQKPSDKTVPPTPQVLNPFPEWESREDNEFVVDL